MAQTEKRMRVLPSLRIGESLENALMRMGSRDPGRAAAGLHREDQQDRCGGEFQR